MNSNNKENTNSLEFNNFIEDKKDNISANMSNSFDEQSTNDNLLSPFIAEEDDFTARSENEQVNDDQNSKLRKLLEDRINNQNNNSAYNLKGQNKVKSKPDLDFSNEISENNSTQGSLQTKENETPASPITRLKEKTDEIISSANNEEINEEELLKQNKESNVDNYSSKAQKIASPQIVSKRILKFNKKQEPKENKNKKNKRTIAFAFFSLLFLLCLSFIFIALEQMQNEESKNYVQNFMSISETDNSYLNQDNQFLEYNNALLRIRKPKFEDEYLNKLITIYYNNYINSFLYENKNVNVAKSIDKPSIAFDFICSTYKDRLLSIIIKIDTWQYNSKQVASQNISNNEDNNLFNAGYNQDGKIDFSTHSKSLNYKQRFVELYYDLYLKRLISPTELMNTSSADGFLREYHLTLNDTLPVEQKLPEISNLRSQKNLPLLLFTNDGINEIIEWKHPSLTQNNASKNRVPEDSYTASATSSASTFKSTLVPYQNLNTILYIDLVYEKEDELAKEKLMENNAETEDKAIEANRKAGTQGTQTDAGNNLNSDSDINSTTQDDLEDLTTSDSDKAKLFFPRQNSPFTSKGQALFSNLPNPYINEAPNSAQDFKYIAFTFDDGPYLSVTPKVLDELDKYSGNATFYILGIAASGAEEMFDKILARGNEIGNHTFYHDPLTNLSKEQVEETLLLTDQVVKSHTQSKYMPVSIRPPYGDINEETASYDPRPFVLWDVDSNDWYNQDNIDNTIANVVSKVQAGSVILMHDSHESSYEALTYILPNLYQQGYRFVTVSKLFEIYHKELKGGAINYAAHD